MSLNDIELNPQLLAGLYSKSLIGETDNDVDFPAKTVLPPKQQTNIIKEPTKAAKPEKSIAAPVSNFKSLGSNQKNVLVGVHYADTTHLPDAQLDFLTNLLKACNLGLGDVAIINMNNFTGIDHNQILENFKTKTVLLFGITAQEFGFPFDILPYQVQQFAGKTVIQSPALHEIENDKAAKGKLWMGLKRIFGI